jgi:hypothetical protein
MKKRSPNSISWPKKRAKAVVYSDERSKQVRTNGWPQLLIDHWSKTKPEDYSEHPDFGDTADLKPLSDPSL